MQVDVEPAGKSRAGKRSAPEFQRQVMDQMERYGRYPMTGPVALDLHFQAAQRNPPGIHRAAKHTLDILGAVLPGCERPRRRSVLYHDDRQIKFLYVLTGHTARVWAVAISGDGTRAVTGSRDSTARVWDLASGCCEHVLTGHIGELRAASVSADGTWAVTSADDTTIRLWNLITGQQVDQWDGEDRITSLAGSADLLQIVAGDNAGQVHILDLGSDLLDAADAASIASIAEHAFPRDRPPHSRWRSLSDVLRLRR